MGQQPLISSDIFPDETKDDVIALQRPRGMPTFEMIKSETALFGLPDTDAEHLFNVWLTNGFRTKVGPIKNWKAAIRVWRTNGYFPSQKLKPSQKDKEEMTNDLLDTFAASPAWKKIDVQKAAWDFKKWCDLNNRKPLISSFIKFLNARL